MADAETTPKLGEWIRQRVHRRFGLPGLVALALLAAAVFAWMNWDEVGQWPGVAPVVELMGREPVPKADPQRFSVMVARIAGDTDDTLGNQVFEVLKDFESIQPLPLDRTVADGGRMGEVEQSEGAKAAREYIAESCASVLVWGKMLDRDKKIARLFLTTSSVAQQVTGRQVSPEIGSTVSLPNVFWEDLAKVLRLAIAVRAAQFEQGHYVADRLPPFITAVRRLVNGSSGQPGWNDDARGETLNLLGVALTALGEQAGYEGPLQEAVETYRSALLVFPRERVPLGWAATQNNLGNALSALGERESATQRLEEAVNAFRAALQEWTRDRVPLHWAATQSNLGTVLARLGERESGIKRLEEAVAAFRAALGERRRERVPLHWAATQNNLGAALARLGERESGIKRLEEAVAAFQAALEERTRERVPLDWAATQNNLGAALALMGKLEGGTRRLRDAIEAFRAALGERARERVPLDWAMTKNNLGIALWILGERTGDRAQMLEAREAINAAFDVYMQAGQEHLRPYFEERLGAIDRQLGEL